MLTVNDLIRRLVKKGIATPSQIVGCAENEIVEIELANRVVLPRSYREFLAAMGHGAGGFLDDCTAFYPDIVSLTGKIRQDFEQTFRIPNEAFVFAERMGETFGYFLADGRSDDPPIYGWSEDRVRPEIAYGSIWEVFEQELGALEH
jgi:hypothetical protein